MAGTYGKGSRCPYCKLPTVVGHKNRDFGECSNCAIVYRFPRPSAQRLALLYEESWSESESHRDETGAMTPRLADELLDALDGSLRALGHAPVSCSRILEFGARTGAMAERLLCRRAKVQTVEPFGHDALLTKGIRNVRRLTDLPEKLEFDGILSFDVIEHLPEPWVDLAELKNWLAPGG